MQPTSNARSRRGSHGPPAALQATRPKSGAAPKRIVNLTYEGVAQSAEPGEVRRAPPEPEARSTARTVHPAVETLHATACTSTS